MENFWAFNQQGIARAGLGYQGPLGFSVGTGQHVSGHGLHVFVSGGVLFLFFMYW